MKQDRFKLIPSVYLILQQDGRFLLSRRFQTGYEDGNYGLVAGHADGGETFRDALVREVREESGIELDPSDLTHVLTMHRWCGHEERADFFFTSSRWKGEPDNMEPDKCDDMQWFPFEALPENTIPYIRKAIECHLCGMPYCEFGWEDK